jgi:hypothetical protein
MFQQAGFSHKRTRFRGDEELTPMKSVATVDGTALTLRPSESTVFPLGPSRESLHAGFEYYRAFDEDLVDNLSDPSLVTMPVPAPGGEHSLWKPYLAEQLEDWAAMLEREVVAATQSRATSTLSRGSIFKACKAVVSIETLQVEGRRATRTEIRVLDLLEGLLSSSN